MALDITNSSIGVSREGMIQVKDSIKVNLIDESINSVNTNVEQLTSNIDNYWHGSAANAFKVKVNSEKSKVVTILKTLEAKLELDLGVMATNSSIADAEVANAIMGISGGTLSVGGANNTSIYTSTINTNDNNITSQSTNNMSITQMNSLAASIDVDGNDTGFLSGLGSTVATAGVSVLEGVGQFGEAAVDTLVVMEAQELAPLINAVDMGSLMYDIATGKEHHSLWDGVKNYVSDQNCKFMFDEMYDNSLSSVKDHCYGFDITRGVGTGVGFTGSVVLTAIGLGGPQTLAAAGGSGGTMSFLMATTGAFTSFGKGTEAAWSDGASWQEGITYGKASALWDGAQYYIGGEINGLSPFAKEGANSLLRVGLDVVDSGAEGFVRPALETIYSDKSYGQLFQEAGGVGNVLTQGAMGGLASGVGEASGLASVFRENKASLGNNVLDNSNIVNSIIDNADTSTVLKNVVDDATDNSNVLDIPKVLNVIDDDFEPTLELPKLNINNISNEVNDVIDEASSKLLNNENSNQIVRDISNYLDLKDTKQFNEYFGTVDGRKSNYDGIGFEIWEKAKGDIESYKNMLSDGELESFNSFLGNTKAGQFLDKLSASEIDVLSNYGGSGNVNESLRKGLDLKNWQSQTKEVLDSAIEKYGGLDDDMILRRSVNVNKEFNQLGISNVDYSSPESVYESLKTLENKSYIDKGYMSTSGGSIPNNGERNDINVVVELATPKGTRAMDIDVCTGMPENEILLARDTKETISEVLPPEINEFGKTIIRVLAIAEN